MSRPASASRRPSRVAGSLAAVAGLALFAYFVERAGVDEVIGGIRRIGWAFLAVLALSGLRFVARALAWSRCMPAGHRLGLRHLLPAFLAGDAVGNLTPMSLIVGEPVKALYLRDRAPLGRTLPALAVENLFYTLSTVVVLAAGGVALYLLVQPPATDWLVTGAPVATLALLVVGAHWIIWHHVPVGSATLSWLAGRGLAPRFLARVAARAHEAERRLHDEYPRERGRLLVVAALEFSFHLLAILEIAVVLALISDRPPTVSEAFVFEAANRFINVIFKFVPMRIGVDEAGTAMFADLLAFGGTTGVTMAVVRKGRMLVWMVVGMSAFVRRGLSVAQALDGASRGAVVVIMARAPGGARAPKTRLQPAIDAEADRRRLYAAFLEDTVSACRTLPGVSLRAAYAPDGGTAGFETVGVAAAELLPQRGADLGERERAVFEDLFADGFSKVVMIGSDLPTLPMARVTDAFARLGDRTAVLGPARDGGYYLIGLGVAPNGASVPDLFTGIRWGTASACDDTVAAATRAGMAVEQLAPWYDVDDSEGLSALRRDLEQTVHANRAPATTRVVREILGIGVPKLASPEPRA